jgi:hypothetical protein
VNHGLDAQLILDEGQVRIEFAEDIGKLAVVVEGYFNPV